MNSQILEQLYENVCIDLTLEILRKTGNCFLVVLDLDCCNPKQVSNPQWWWDLLVQCRSTPNSLAMEKVAAKSRQLTCLNKPLNDDFVQALSV